MLSELLSVAEYFHSREHQTAQPPWDVDNGTGVGRVEFRVRKGACGLFGLGWDERYFVWGKYN
jgi:hypothetical protein